MICAECGQDVGREHDRDNTVCYTCDANEVAIAGVIAEAAALPDYVRPVSFIAYRLADVLGLRTTDERLAFFRACHLRS